MQETIEAKVKKLKTCGCIHEKQHPNWLANNVQVKKKNGKLHIFIDFRDLNNACPKDNFSLPITNKTINNIYNFEIIFFIDGKHRRAVLLHCDALLA